MDEEQEAIEAAAGSTMSEPAESALDTLAEMFVGRFGGAFFDGDGTLVALVKDLDPAEESAVRAQLCLKEVGVRLASARYAEAELESFADLIDDDNVSAIAIDVEHSQLVLHVGRELSDTDLAELLGEVPPDAVRVELGEVYMQW